MVTSGEDVLVSNSPYFGYFFTRGGPCPKEFSGGPHLGIEFEVHLKWILDEHWDSDLRVAKATNAPHDPG